MICQSLHDAATLLRRALLLLLLASGCSNGTSGSVCESDEQCPLPGTRCGLEFGQCVCATDEACDTGQFCNRAGVCQDRGGCVTGADCETEPGTFCDIASGRCIPGPAETPASACGLVSHCPLEHICVNSACAPGCHDDGDCKLGNVCVQGQCMGGNGLCNGDDFCAYGERCVMGMCKRDRRGPYCRGCSQPTGANPEPCDAPKNLCLLNVQETDGFDQFCGVDCSLGQPCPNGYSCGPVAVLTDDECTAQVQCMCDRRTLAPGRRTCVIAAPCRPASPNADTCVAAGHPSCAGGACLVTRGQTDGRCTCVNDGDCDNNATCVGGFCCTGEIRRDRRCVGGEGARAGLCTCSTDDDCPRDSCDGSRGVCRITGEPCVPGNNDCLPIPCVNGGCQVGRNCAPAEGLSCSELTR